MTLRQNFSILPGVTVMTRTHDAISPGCNDRPAGMLVA